VLTLAHGGFLPLRPAADSSSPARP
jgi:hypothetical protein